jgi:hypothetical protein
MPIAIQRAIDAELSTSKASDKIPDERACAEFFAWLAVRRFAPRALRQAGYHQLAGNCETQSDLWNGMIASATAQHTIGREYRDVLITPRAYGACAHAATAAFYAGVEEMETVVQTGEYSARALVSPLPEEDEGDIDSCEAQWIWEAAVTTINAAIDIRSLPASPQSPAYVDF